MEEIWGKLIKVKIIERLKNFPKKQKNQISHKLNDECKFGPMKLKSSSHIDFSRIGVETLWIYGQTNRILEGE